MAAYGRDNHVSRRPAVIALLFIVFIVVLVFWPRGADLKKSFLSEYPAASVTSTGSASQPATTSQVVAWEPPRFTGRQKERDTMVQVIRAYGLKDKAVLRAMGAVPRHEFVPEHLSKQAYADNPLPIGYGQTISQPYIVAEMTRLLELKPNSHVLEIGTGSGYQAAVLTEFTPHVYTIEIVRPLAEAAEKRLKRLGYDVVEVRMGDGYYGWPEKAPFDGIVVTAAAAQIPPPLLQQLAPGGRMVIPVGGVFSQQSLTLVTKEKDGTVRSRSLMPVSFVPFVRGQIQDK
jgi:protein-L-isoaspartate(D-aspartate) O-methyltransferase